MGLLSVFSSEKDGIPTSVDFVRDDPTRMVTSYTSAACLLFDLETGQAVTRLDTDQGVEDSVFGRQINRVISHPTLPLTITATKIVTFVFMITTRVNWLTPWWLTWTPSLVRPSTPTDSIFFQEVTIAASDCGTWRTKRACRKSLRTARNSTNPFSTWPSIRVSRLSPRLEPMPSRKSSSKKKKNTKKAN